MAYSNLEFHGRFVRIHDLDLSIACFLIMECGKDRRSDFLGGMFESWVESIASDGPGCIDLRLEYYLENQGHVDMVADLIGKTIKVLDVMVGVCPKDRLNSMLASVKIKLDSDYKVDLIRQALIGLRKAVVGE